MIPECAIIVAVSALILDILSGDPPSGKFVFTYGTRPNTGMPVSFRKPE